MKTIRNLLLFIIISFCSLFICDNVFAASASISVKGTSRKIIVGETVKVTITVSSSSKSSPLGAWEFDVKYDSTKLSLVGSTLESKTRSVGYSNNDSTFSKTYTMTFKAKKSGTAKVYVDNSLVVDFNTEKPLTSSEGSTSLSIITQSELEASYSKDNYLSSLSVSGYNLTPKFDKNTLEYSLEVENDVREITVSAKANDSKAEVEGTGKHSLVEGSNEIKVSVTAENGNVRNYVLNVIVKELDPVYINIEEKTYTVVRKTEDLEYPTTFIPTTTIIQSETVPAFESTITGYLLVALRDENGNVEFYIVDGDTYKLYKETSFSGIVLYIIEPEKDDIPEGYELTSMSIAGVATNAYKSDSANYPLLYGINVQTGKTNWYTYDEDELTLQRYMEPKNVEVEEVDATKYFIIIGILGGSTILLLVFILLLNSKLRKYVSKKIAK